VEALPDRVAPEEPDSALRIDLARRVERLDVRDRELIALRYGADLTARQIAELQEARVNTVEVALHRAVGRLRAAYDELHEPRRTAASQP
jgi:RNA polymerase sigma factor (sigma-70 family)